MSARGNRDRSRRLFVAVYPTEEARRTWLRLVPWQDLPPHRRPPEAQIHLTILFIGDVAPRRLDSVVESIERSTAGISPFDLVSERVIALPERRPARVIAVQTNAPSALLELRSRLVRRLASSARRKPNDRFIPHLTLARISPPQRIVLTDAASDRAARALTRCAFRVDSIHLVESRLHPWGAEHQTLAETRLDG